MFVVFVMFTRLYNGLRAIVSKHVCLIVLFMKYMAVGVITWTRDHVASDHEHKS